MHAQKQKGIETCLHTHTHTHRHTQVRNQKDKHTLLLTALEEDCEQVVPGVFAVHISVAGEKHGGGGLGHADALLVSRLVLELILVVLVT